MGSVIDFVKTSANRPGHGTAPEVAVLVVDDDEPVRKCVERVLKSAQYQITLAASGRQALEEAAAMARIDLLVTDLMMPEMQGDELARRLRQREPRLKVLYLTGYSDRSFTDRITLWEDDAVLDKPCSINGLLQAVSMLVCGRVEQPKESTS